MTDVSDVLRDRMQEPPGLERMVAIAALAHAALIAAVILAPGGWLSHQKAPPRTVMTISLGGGTPGPVNGGMNQMGGRPVQEQTPPDTPKRPEPATPPAAKVPEMTVPLRGRTQAKTTPLPTVKQAPDDAKGRKPTRGAQTAAGSTVTDTQVRGQGFGLSTSGGAPGGSGATVDVADFCCPDYLTLMAQRIKEAWDPKGEAAARVVIKFVILRNGTISNSQLEKPSGYFALDQRALRAVAGARPLPQLPDRYSNPTLIVHLTFEYNQ